MAHSLEMQRLMADVEAIRERIEAQQERDPDHVVALAMFRKDLERAIAKVTECELNDRRRTYVDGRRVA